jgi:hypothetical protein
VLNFDGLFNNKPEPAPVIDYAGMSDDDVQRIVSVTIIEMSVYLEALKLMLKNTESFDAGRSLAVIESIDALRKSVLLLLIGKVAGNVFGGGDTWPKF